MPHSKLLTLQEVAEMFGLKPRQVSGAMQNYLPSITEKHSVFKRLPGENQVRRLYTPLGVKRLEYLCRYLIRRAKTAQEAKIAQEGMPVGPTIELPPKYNGIEKISKPKLSENDMMASRHELWAKPQFFSKPKEMDESVEKRTSEDDEVLDIAVKIIAERTAFNKIKDEIVMLREENEKLKSAHIEMCQTLNLIGSAMHGWRQM